MPANISTIAYRGSRESVWHRLGVEHMEGATPEAWAAASGLSYRVHAVDAIPALAGPEFDHLDPAVRMLPADEWRFLVRGDNGAPLGVVSPQYRIVQPAEILSWFERYIGVDSRFQLDVAGTLNGGRQIWATAIYNGGLEIAGEEHDARILMSTSYDGASATVNQMTTTRVVCQNTLRIAHADKRAAVRTVHRARFDAGVVARELATLAKGIEQYKNIGDAMGRVEFSKQQIADFFKDVLDIDKNTKREDLPARTLNRYLQLGEAYRTTVQEGAPRETVWAALQAVTRYVDHDRDVRGTTDRAESGIFGTGDAVKGKAMQLLMPLIKREAVLVGA